ncbi:MAG: ABC transporter permease [Saprospiraceae bacterium]|nr:ABC transporter permease [Saprospiraceae bacterium]
MLNRHISDFGLNPAVGIALLPILFLGLSYYLFAKTEFAEYLYVFLCASLLSNLSEAGRNDFIKTCFSDKDYRRIRVLENVILVIPFVAFLLFKGCIISTTILLLLAGILAFMTFGNKFNYTIPTPFYRRPFEFIVGFRKTFWLVLIAYIMAYMGIVVGNFNLGLFSLMLVFFNCMYFYAYPENAYYVWIFKASPKRFLVDKIKTALLFSTILSLPIMIGHLFFYTDKFNIILGLQCLGYMYLLAAVLAKYSAFPAEVSLPQAFLFAFGIVFPPALLAIIPYFYIQSIKSLKEILQ